MTRRAVHETTVMTTAANSVQPHASHWVGSSSSSRGSVKSWGMARRNQQTTTPAHRLPVRARSSVASKARGVSVTSHTRASQLPDGRT